MPRVCLYCFFALIRVHPRLNVFLRSAPVLHQSNRTSYTSFSGAADCREEAYNEGPQKSF